MHRVFLSHNSADKPQVIRLARALIDLGVRVWLDVFELRPADWWGEKIGRAIETSAVVLACIGEHGKGPWHDRELDVAHQRGIDIRVVCLPGWKPEHGRLGLDDRIADNLHTDWGGGIVVLAAALASRASASNADEPRPAPRQIVGPFDGSPYPGIDRSFESEHAAWYFGREAETAELVRALLADRWVWLVGNSGSGKSSVARAGVMSWWPHATRGDGVATVFEPTARATEDLAGALDRAFRASGVPAVDLQRLATAPAGWSAELRARYGDAKEPASILVVVDQAEQIFGLRTGRDHEESSALRGTCDAMLSTLWQLATDQEGPVRVHVLVVLRADWLHRALKEPILQPMFQRARTQVTLPSMDDADLRDAIVVPARHAGGAVDEHAVVTLVRSVRGREHGLPLLQLVLQRAWRAVVGTDRVIRIETIGTQPLDNAIAALVGEQESVLNRSVTPTDLDALVPALVELDDRDAPRRRRMRAEDVNALADRVQRALEVLVNARIVVAQASGDGSIGGGWQLAHEAVFTWPALEQAIGRRSEVLKQIAALERLAKDQAGTPLQGPVLGRYESLRDQTALSERARDYLIGSLETAGKTRRFRRRAVGMIVGVLALLGLALAIASVVAWSQARRAEREADNAHAEATRAQLRLAESYFEQGRRALVGDNSPQSALSHLAMVKPRGTRGAVLETMLTATTANLWLVQLTHTKMVNTAIFSPDGMRIVTASNDSSARIWDATSGLPRSPPLKHAGEVNMAVFSPDGSVVVTASNDRTARLWSTASGSPVSPPLEHQQEVIEAAFSADGTRVATASLDGTTRVWDVTTGRALFEPLKHDDGGVISVAFSADGTRMVTVTNNGTVRLWNATSGRALSAPLQQPGNMLVVAFSPDGSQLAIAGLASARILDVTSQRVVELPLEREEFQGTSIAFSPDGSRLVIGGSDGSARVLDTSSRRELFPPLHHSAAVEMAAFSPDGTRIVTASGRNARIWDASSGLSLSLALEHESPVRTAAFSPDGSRVVTTTTDGTARVWDATLASALSLPFDHKHLGRYAAFNEDGSRVITTNSDTARVWDATSGRPISPPIPNLSAIRNPMISPDGKHVVTASTQGVVRIWDVSSGRQVSPDLVHPAAILTCVCGHDGSHVITVSADRILRVWETTSGRVLAVPIEQPDRMQTAELSADGKRVVTTNGDHLARVWDATSGRALSPALEHAAHVRTAKFSSDGALVLTTSDDNTARVWDATSGRALSPPLIHKPNLWTASLSPDGSRVVTVAEDDTARIWDTASGRAACPPLRHVSNVNDAAFSPDGTRIATISVGEPAHLWDAESGRALPMPIESADQVTAAVFSPDGTRIITITDFTARVWTMIAPPLSDDNLQVLANARGAWVSEFAPNASRFDATALVHHIAREHETAATRYARASNLLASAYMALPASPKLAQQLASDAAKIYRQLEIPDQLASAQTCLATIAILGGSLGAARDALGEIAPASDTELLARLATVADATTHRPALVTAIRRSVALTRPVQP